MNLTALGTAALLLSLSFPCFAEEGAASQTAAPSTAAAAPAPAMAPVAPAYDLNGPPPMRRHSKPMMAAGIVLSSVGALSSAIGVVLLVMRDTGYDSCVSANETVVSVGIDPIECKKHDYTAAGVGFLVAGGSLIGAGIPLAVVGGHKVPADDPRPKAGLWLMPKVGATGGTMVLSGRF